MKTSSMTQVGWKVSLCKSYVVNDSIFPSASCCLNSFFSSSISCTLILTPFKLKQTEQMSALYEYLHTRPLPSAQDTYKENISFHLKVLIPAQGEHLRVCCQNRPALHRGCYAYSFSNYSSICDWHLTPCLE